ncbi:MAG: stage III sporulation AC/AD family protein [Clostridia bacterium]|nr:stage III sporulation AC/AD family protein [Clostridia bacterium]
MNIISICAFAVFAAAAVCAVRAYSGAFTTPVIIAGMILLSMAALPFAKTAADSINAFSETAQIKKQYIEALLKSVGICLLTQFSADTCRESGAQSIAGQVEVCGKLAVLAIAVPLYTDLLDLVKELL